jgi:hypothetical protein
LVYQYILLKYTFFKKMKSRREKTCLFQGRIPMGGGWAQGKGE